MRYLGRMQHAHTVLDFVFGRISEHKVSCLHANPPDAKPVLPAVVFVSHKIQPIHMVQD